MARKSKGNEMYKDLFNGASATTVSIGLLAEEMDQATALIGENGWPEQEGLHIIFANGLAALQGIVRRQDLADADGEPDAEAERLVRELMDMESKYAVMKFRAYTLDQERQVMQMNVTGLEIENRMSGKRLWQFRADEEMLRAEIKQLKRENAGLMRQLAVLRGEATAQPEGRGILWSVTNAIRGKRRHG
ncbi:MAG TPA: hypothetical protein VLS25_02430 [Dehalococcoidia bacterium]|nr:hypothetical protein [Dehalococcoidia bacterium]